MIIIGLPTKHQIVSNHVACYVKLGGLLFRLKLGLSNCAMLGFF